MCPKCLTFEVPADEDLQEVISQEFLGIGDYNHPECTSDNRDDTRRYEEACPQPTNEYFVPKCLKMTVTMTSTVGPKILRKCTIFAKTFYNQ